MQIKPIEEIRAFLEDFALPMGIEIVDVEFDKKNNALTVFIETDRAGNLTRAKNLKMP